MVNGLKPERLLLLLFKFGRGCLLGKEGMSPLARMEVEAFKTDEFFTEFEQELFLP